MRALQKHRFWPVAADMRAAAPAVALFFGLFLSTCPGVLRASVAQVCDSAADRVARESDVPKSVLMAITRTETGRNRSGGLAPWPWTVNMEGKGHWFDSRARARAYVQQQFERGVRSFDIGCFQINYKWHGTAFRSIDQMFDPIENARYAAAFLARLHDELGDWSKAAGAYHSRTPEYARRYRARFDRIHKTVAGESLPARPRPVAAALASGRRPARDNRYPLLQEAGQPARRGSLVPLNSGARPLFSISGGS